MLADIIKFYFIYFCAIYICLRLLNYHLTTVLHKIVLIVIPFILTCLTHLFNLYIIELTYISPLMLLWILISILSARPQESFIATSIAFGISYVLSALSSFIATILLSPIRYSNLAFPFTILALLTAIIQTLLMMRLFHIKRFQKGMPFLFSTTFINAATTICLFIIAFWIYLQTNHSSFAQRVIAPILLIISLAFLIHWWQAQITKSYKRSLEQRELESLRIELQEKDKQIAELKAESIKFGDITHEYNKLIPPLAEAVCEYLEADFWDAETTRSKGQALSAQLRTQSEKLAQTTAMVNAKKYKHHDTGIDGLDTYLNFYEKRAVEENVEFSVHLAADLKEYVPRAISSDDFTHLIVNLLSNAFIAIADCAEPMVQLQFYKVGKHFVIEVSDNGIPFEVDSLINYGLERITTHEDTGGSGVGLVAIWNMKETYGATLHIEEYEAPAPFAKKISLIFNKKNLYSIRTWRKEEILQASKRIDLQVYDFEQ